MSFAPTAVTADYIPILWGGGNELDDDDNDDDDGNDGGGAQNGSISTI